MHLKIILFYTIPLCLISVIGCVNPITVKGLIDTCQNVLCSKIVWNLISLSCPNWISDILWVLYDVKNGEGFYLQRSVFDRMVLSIAILNVKIQKQKRNNIVSLVLPPFCNVAHWSYKENRRLFWSLFYNIKQDKVLIFEYDILKHLIGNNESKAEIIGLYLDYNGKYEKKTTSIETYSKYEIMNRKFVNSGCDFDKYIRGKRSIYSGYCEYMHVNNLYCFNYYKLMRSKEISDSIYELFTMRQNQKLPVFLLKHVDSILVPWPWELDDLEVIDVLQHSKYIMKKYKNYISKNEFFSIGNEYLSVHLRRNDFVVVRKNEVPSFERVLYRSLQLSKELGINHVLISTDGNDEEKNVLRKIFEKSGLIIHIIDTNFHEEDGITSAISQVILLNGKYFIGTKESRFSFSVSWECTLKERYKKKLGFGHDFNRCNEYFCGSETQFICREHEDRLPKVNYYH